MTAPLGRVSTGALLAHSLLIQAVAFLVRPAISYAALDLGVAPVAVGAVGATFALVPLVLAIGAGRMVDRYGDRIAMLLGAIVATVACLVLVLTSGSLVGILVGSALLGAGHLGCIIGQQAVVARSARAGSLDSMFGYYTFAASLGQAIGPGLLLLGGDAVGPDTSLLFTIGGGMALALVPLTFAIRRAAARTATADAPERSTSTWRLLRAPGVAKAIGTSALVVAAVDLTVVYLPALGSELGLGAAAVGVLLAVRALASMASRLILGIATRRLGRKRLLVTSIVLAAVSLLALAIPMPYWPLLAIAVVLGLGLGVGQPLTMSWLVEQTPNGARGRALALRLAGNRLSQLTIPALAGLFAAFGSGVALGTMGLLLASTLILMRGLRLDEDGADA